MFIQDGSLTNQDGNQIKGGNQAKHNRIKINMDEVVKDEVDETDTVELDPEKEEIWAPNNTLRK